MTSYQLSVMYHFDRRRVNALYIAGRWIWRDDIRRDARLAREIYNWLGL